MNKVAKKIIRSFSFAIKGLRHAWKIDQSFRLEISLGLPLYVIFGSLMSPLTDLELITLVFSYLFILAIELLNTSIEHLLDRLHPDGHEMIERSKDIASSAVLMSFIFAFFVFMFVMFN